MVRKTKPDKRNKRELRGTNSIYDPKLHPDIAENICRTKGLKNSELSDVFGIKLKTLEHWMKVHPELKEAIKRGRDDYDVHHVENSLLKRALGYEYEEITVKQINLKEKNEDGEIIIHPAKEIYRTKKEVAPDVKACMFWLQNRNPERWKNTKYLNVESKNTTKHLHEHKIQEETLKALSKDELRTIKKCILTTDSDSREGISREKPDRLH